MLHNIIEDFKENIDARNIKLFSCNYASEKWLLFTIWQILCSRKNSARSKPSDLCKVFSFFLAENTWGKLKFATRLTRRRPSLIINYALRHSGRLAGWQAGWQVDSLPLPSGCQTFTGLAADRGCSIAGATPTPPRADIWYSYVCNEMSSVLLQLQMQSLLLLPLPLRHKSFEKVRGHMLLPHVQPMSAAIVKCLIYARQQHGLQIAAVC